MSITFSCNYFQPENGFIQDKFDWKSQSCECCPYGYHIDLDFVRYCATVSQHSERTATMNKRRERRRQRQSMEMLLGVPTPAMWTIEQYMPQIPQESPIAKKDQGKIQVSLVQDALEDVVSDFERTFQHSKHVNHINSKTNNITEPLHRTVSNSSLSSISELGYLSTPIKQSILEHSEFDGNNIESGLSAGALKIIREQMALGLERIRELEKKVKLIPSLQGQVTKLKEEKKMLLITIEKQKQNLITLTNVNITKSVQHAQKAAIVARRDASTMCNVITRNIGVGSQHTKTRSISTSTCRDIEIENKENIPVSPIPKELLSQATQTIIYNKESSSQTLEFVKHIRTIGLTVKPMNADVASQITVKTNTIGVSDNTTDSNICSKCNVSKHTIAVGPNNQENHAPVSLKNLSVPRSKSFSLGDEKLSTSKQNSISCQTEHLSVSKSSQSDVKVTSRYSQYEYKATNKGTQYENTFHKDLRKDVACNTSKINRNSVSTNTEHTVNRSKSLKSPDGGCRKDDSPLVSRIPRLSEFFSSSPDGIKFQRQNTYTKIAAVSPNTASDSRLSGLDLSPTTTSQIDIVSKEATTSVIKDKHVHPKELNSSTEEKRTHLLESQSRLATSEITQTSLESTLYHSGDNNARQKVVPSREMQAAMKVLNDALHKSDGNHVRSHVKSAIDIIQQQWFKVSSLVNANPLDVEDYLDSFEEVSSTLLEYIVNMTDDSGNTAMHYAVSHGNFDVVSILLDSKVCNINQPNKAGYTSVMLVSLAEIRSPTHITVVRRLFHLADVNIRAKQHGQTALMLAVSHGRLDMVQMLLEAGADINIQDEDGSTSLMCAAEHGHIDIVKYFLSHPDCDSTITDMDGSTALKISLEAGHKDIGVLLYAHEHSVHGTSPYSTLRHRKFKGSNVSLKHTDSS